LTDARVNPQNTATANAILCGAEQRPLVHQAGCTGRVGCCG